MINIKKTKDGWVVYQSRSFRRFHTHTKFYRVAKKIKWYVNNRIIPIGENKEIIKSCKRIAIDEDYIKQLNKILKEE